ncbi:MAG: RimK family alpha-L-glutamate ligase, partial [Methanoregulaceae archaeon]|nr:RimK family alpha-L-glutamate ligase [Methanoregulaceae archaeon]
MIHIIPKPTDTPNDNSTAAVAGEIRNQGGAYDLLDIHCIDPFVLPFEHELVWVCGLTQEEHPYEVLQAL